MFKLFIITALLLILAALASAMISLVQDKGEGDKTVKALTARITLSMALLVILFLGYKIGWITPHGL